MIVQSGEGKAVGKHGATSVIKTKTIAERKGSSGYELQQQKDMLKALGIKFISG